MRSFYFRPGRNAATALISGALAAWSGWLWLDDGSIVWLASLLLLGAAAVRGVLNALNSEPAVKFDNERLWVRTMFGTQAILWSKVYGIALQVVTIRYWGIIPIGRKETLCVAVEGGPFGARRLRVAASTIELPAGGAPELVQILRNAQLSAVGPAGVAMAGADRTGWGVPSKSVVERDETAKSGFDADAAIARYLASKDAAQNAMAAPLPKAPAAAAAQQRPVFGRRQAS